MDQITEPLSDSHSSNRDLCLWTLTFSCQDRRHLFEHHQVLQQFHYQVFSCLLPLEVVTINVVIPRQLSFSSFTVRKFVHKVGRTRLVC